jgi:hypothetical protein
MSFSTLMGIRDWDFPNSMHERDLTTRFSGISRGSAFLDIGSRTTRFLILISLRSTAKVRNWRLLRVELRPSENSDPVAV